MIHSTNRGLMLVQRLKQWPGIYPPLGDIPTFLRSEAYGELTWASQTI